MKIPAAVWLSAALTLAPLVAVADTVAVRGATFAVTAEAGERPLVLAGAGVATYKVVFTVYAAALHVPPRTRREAVLAADTPRRLTIEYFYDIDREDLVRAANEVLARQLDDGERAAVAAALTRFHDLYRSVSEGDRYTMTYVPGEGTTLALNGEPLGTVSAAGFAAAYFGIWLGEHPLSPDLRGALLERLPRG